MKKLKNIVGNRENVLFLIAGVILLGVTVVFISMIGQIVVWVIKEILNLFW